MTWECLQEHSTIEGCVPKIYSVKPVSGRALEVELRLPFDPGTFPGLDDLQTLSTPAGGNDTKRNRKGGILRREAKVVKGS